MWIRTVLYSDMSHIFVCSWSIFVSTRSRRLSCEKKSHLSIFFRNMSIYFSKFSSDPFVSSMTSHHRGIQGCSIAWSEFSCDKYESSCLAFISPSSQRGQGIYSWMLQKYLPAIPGNWLSPWEKIFGFFCFRDSLTHISLCVSCKNFSLLESLSANFCSPSVSKNVVVCIHLPISS